MQPTDAAHEAYARLLAARRVIDPLEQAEIEREAQRERETMKMRRRLPKVY